MSYPDPRYHGKTGEISATYRPSTTAPDITYGSGTTCEYLATGASTDGLFGLYRWSMTPKAGGPEAHFHRTMVESFYVLIGTVKIFDGHEWLDTQPPATSSMSRRAAFTASATTRMRPPRCSSTSPPARHGRPTSRGWLDGPPRVARTRKRSRRSTRSTTICSSSPVPRGTPAREVRGGTQGPETFLFGRYSFGRARVQPS
jgi:hypothetical protein